MTNQKAPARGVLGVVTAIVCLLLVGGGMLVTQPAMASQSATAAEEHWPILNQNGYSSGDVTTRAVQYLLNAHGATLATDTRSSRDPPAQLGNRKPSLVWCTRTMQ
jgi:hypothetical protein